MEQQESPAFWFEKLTRMTVIGSERRQNSAMPRAGKPKGMRSAQDSTANRVGVPTIRTAAALPRTALESNAATTIECGASVMSGIQSPEQNHILRSLPSEARARLLPYLKSVSLPLGSVLYESGGLMRQIYFPTDAIVSLLYVLDSGASAEIAVVGNDGAVGVSLFMGGETTTSRAVVQSAGHAYRMTGVRLKREFGRHGDLMYVLLRYTQSLITQMAQTAVCNRHHSVEQQLCRWLLLSLDRLSSDEIVMTHELIANMLGVRREGVTDAAGKLQKLGVIRYRRGRITVLSRPELERLCCECYGVVRRETERLLPRPADS